MNILNSLFPETYIKYCAALALFDRNLWGRKKVRGEED